MRCVHLFELEDQPWFPEVLRDGMTAYISWLMAATDMLAPVLPRIVEVVGQTGAPRVVDLCSGAGLPALQTAQALRDAGLEVPVVCTDLFPNRAALQRVAEGSGGRVSSAAGPVDATAVPEALDGVRTVFDAFHHFRPDGARAILRDAHDKRQPIVVVETVDRRPANVMGMVGVPFAVLAGGVVRSTSLATPRAELESRRRGISDSMPRCWPLPLRSIRGRVLGRRRTTSRSYGPPDARSCPGRRCGLGRSRCRTPTQVRLVTGWRGARCLCGSVPRP